MYVGAIFYNGIHVKPSNDGEGVGRRDGGDVPISESLTGGGHERVTDAAGLHEHDCLGKGPSAQGRNVTVWVTARRGS